MLELLSDVDRAWLARVVTDPATFGEVFFQREWLEGQPLPPFAGAVYRHLLDAGAAPAGDIDRVSELLPRGFLKTTLVSQVLALWKAITDPGSYIVIITATGSLRNDISSAHDVQLRGNERLRRIFGDQVSHDDKKWNIGKRVFRNQSEIRYATYGEQIRGTKSSRARRPTWVILDDIETTDQAESPEQTEALKRWLVAEVEPALDPRGKLIHIGNIINTRSLANQFAEGKIPGWRHQRFAACDFETGWVLWPNHPRFGDIGFFRRRLADLQGSNLGHLFWSEMMNAPVEAADKRFTVEMFRRVHWGDLFDGLEPRVPLRAFAAVDLAYTKKKKSDKTAWGVGVTDWQNELHVLELKKKKLEWAERIDLIFDIYTRWAWLGLSTIGIEGNPDFLAAVDAEMVARRKRNPSSPFFAVEALSPKGVAKTDRINEFAARMRTVLWLWDPMTGTWSPEVAEGVGELLDWTESSSVDDAADAVSYLRRMAKAAARPRALPAGTLATPASQRLQAELAGKPVGGLSLAAKAPTRG